MSAAPYVFADLCFDPTDGRLAQLRGPQSTQLRPQLARLLRALLDRPQTVVERTDLCRAVWDEGVVVDFEAGLAAILRELRSELKGLGASAELIETIPRRGCRLNCLVRRQPGPASFSSAARKRVLGLGLALIVLLAATLFALRQTPEPVFQPLPGLSLAVLPFSQFGSASADPRQLDLLLADQLLVQLWDRQLDELILIGRASIAAHHGRSDLAQAVAEGLGVELLIEGSLVFDQDRVAISARLLEMPVGQILWSQQLEFAEDELPPVSVLAVLLVDSLAAFWAERQADGD